MRAKKFNPDQPKIRILGAKQHNLKHIDIDFAQGEITVVTGVSGSGKSSLVFDTLYAEGQRRYVETFSPYARQFLDRMDKPEVDSIEGILPAIAIGQTNPVRSSRSTVGTMTEINDYLKLLYARAAQLQCRQCKVPVENDTPQTIAKAILDLARKAGSARMMLTFPVQVPASMPEQEVQDYLSGQGYTRVHETIDMPDGRLLQVVQDRFRADTIDPDRLVDSLGAALLRGKGKVSVYWLPPKSIKGASESLDECAPSQETASQPDGQIPEFPSQFAQGLHCAVCDIQFSPPMPNHFSFNSPLGACETCRGFGRVIGIDYGLVVPDESLSLEQGCVKPWQTPSYLDCQRDLIRFAKKRGVATNIAFRDLPVEHQNWVIDGDPLFDGKWNGPYFYGVAEFFKWLESRSYKMHVRVMLSKYRSYTPCPACGGTRLKPQAQSWKLSAQSISQVMAMPLSHLSEFVDNLQFSPSIAQGCESVLHQLKNRLRFLNEVGLGYLTLDRQSRTLSGGEVQRINLTTALGSSLVNTLFVLDEPSVGLHPRDINQIARAMQRLRAAGNTLVVVEHDPQLMACADRLVDIGPGPGEAGGRVMFEGSPNELMRSNTLTAQYLTGAKRVVEPSVQHSLQAPGSHSLLMCLRGVSANNLKHIDFKLPLHQLVVLTGVSGSGKSTLVEHVLVPALLKYKGQPTEAPGEFEALEGADHIADLVFVDQSPIGKNARSTPASYVGAFDEIRKLFAKTPEAKARGYKPGFFSCNSGDGRCPACGGSGFEQVEMQFLSDVYLRCAECNGTRYRAETLEIVLERPGGGLNLAEVLDLTVDQALDWFERDAAIHKRLVPLAQVGLGYIRLGQPVPTLSGGEAQRLKLAGHLGQLKTTASGQKVARKGNLFVFDEPTTGLHFEDVAKLMQSLKRLQEGGHSVLIVEHNLDVMCAADWIIDLGPEAGEAGGEVVASGSPHELAEQLTSHTGLAIARYLGAQNLLEGTGLNQPGEEKDGLVGTQPHNLNEPQAAYGAAKHEIEIINAREHNLKNLSLAIPRGQLTVITGPSGSGKSTLAFDILFSEGQRRYLESLNAYARQFVQPAAKPDVDAIYGIAPTVAIEQRTSRGGRKSTVATITEIYHFLRLLFMKLGVQYCPRCQVPITPQSEQSILAQLMKNYKGQTITLMAPLVQARKGVYNELGQWAQAKGHPVARIDGHFVATHPWPKLGRYQEHNIELPLGTIEVSQKQEGALMELLQTALTLGKGAAVVLKGPVPKPAATRVGTSSKAKPELPHGPAPEVPINYLSTKRACPICGRSFPEPDPRQLSYNSKHGWCTTCYGVGEILPGMDADQTGEEGKWLNASLSADDSSEPEQQPQPCPSCNGKRLNPTALALYFDHQNIACVVEKTVDQALEWVKGLQLTGRQAAIASTLQQEMTARLKFLSQVGLGYLSLDRAAPTLSGGEAQRIRLAAQLGTNLEGVCYVLDEPSIGLHPRDNKKLIQALLDLKNRNNTLVVVEHDVDTMRQADCIVDMGPGAGSRGGQVVAQGTVHSVASNPDSLTGRYLAQPLPYPTEPRRPVQPDGPKLTLHGATLHNVNELTLQIPLKRFVAVTGVSGSGKSTLMRDILLQNLKRYVAHQSRRQTRDSAFTWQHCELIEGVESLERVLEVDQTPIGKTPRSCPATYIGFWNRIRNALADTLDARMRGFKANQFSFNTGPGRCPVCEGQGMQTLEMNFLPDVKVTCEACGGARFNPETLQVRWRDHSVADILNMNVEEALEFFSAHPGIAHPLQLMADVGLGYLTLGQPSPTLSGGEAQRIKLVTELSKVKANRTNPSTLYVLDEPTVGLHMNDVEKLIQVLHRLVDAGHTVIVIEHDLDVIAQADWVIDIGPEAGARGGQLVDQASPQHLARETSHTGGALLAHKTYHSIE